MSSSTTASTKDIEQPRTSKKTSNESTGKEAKKSVSFKKLVDIFHLTEAWQMQVEKSNLKTEEDQAKRRLQKRNY